MQKQKNKIKFDSVKLSKLEHFVEVAKNLPYAEGTDPELPFEYVISALFPHGFDNLHEHLTQIQADAFREGYKAAREEMEK